MSAFLDVLLTLVVAYLSFLTSTSRLFDCRSDRCDRLHPSDTRTLIYRP
jgi:hypothetical protein